MSALYRASNSCATCGQSAGAFTCRGCSKNFCLLHTNEHRKELEKQMNDIILDHNEISNQLKDFTVTEHHRSLLQEIDLWEQKSMKKIQQMANDIRQELEKLMQNHQQTLQDKLTQLTEQLTVARVTGDFFEQDLNNWITKLRKLRQSFIEERNLKIYHVDEVKSFISRISLHKHAKNYEVVKQNPILHALEHSNNLNMTEEYSSGDHLFRFKIDHDEENSFLLIGVISAKSSANSNPPENRTFYGWSTDQLIYLHGVAQTNERKNSLDIEKNDTFQLTLDCRRKLIRLMNERTYRVHDLQVDLNRCPLPWKPHVRLLFDMKKKTNQIE